MISERKSSSVVHLFSLIAPFVLLVIGAMVVAVVVLPRYRQAEHGAVYGVPAEVQSGAKISGLGVTADLTRLLGNDRARGEYSINDALDDVARAGLTWVRQPFPWAEIEPEKGLFDWQSWDEVAAACQRHGIDLIPVLYTSPPWSRPSSDSNELFSPPESFADFGNFAEAVASRYGDAVDSYQIWDAPNIQPNWGNGWVSPTEYMRLLREGSIRIKDADPVAAIVLAGLAPTTESGPINMSEPLFLDALYKAGAEPYFDVVAAKAYGFWSGPDDRRLDHSVLNFSRVILLRDVMLANGDEGKPVWAVESGWNALPADWAGLPSPWGTDAEELQAQRTADAVKRARIEWPWLTAIGLARLLPPADPSDPSAGFALLDEDGKAGQLYRWLVAAAEEPPLAYPGHHTPVDPAIDYSDGLWRVQTSATDVGMEGDAATLDFYGTRVDLKVRRGRFWGLFYVTVDGGAANGLPVDSEGRAYLILHDPLEHEAVVTVASRLIDGPHTLQIEAHGGWGQWPLLGFTVIRDSDTGPTSMLWVICLMLGLVGACGVLYNGLFLPWDTWLPAVLSLFESLGERVQVAGLVVLGLVFYFSPSSSLSALVLVMMLLMICLRPVLGLMLVTFCVPFFLQAKRLPGHSFSLVELALALALIGSIVHFGLRYLGSVRWKIQQGSSPGNALLSEIATGPVRFDAVLQLDLSMILFAGAGIVSVLAAENFGVANRELRVVIMEPVLFYFLLRFVPMKRKDLWLLVDALILSAAALAAIGLYQYFFTADVITAEGVRRIKGVYASPNNLSLFLGRMTAFLAALFLSLPSSFRRWGYGVAFIPVVICLYLTFSRGAWLVGLPAALLFLMIVLRGRTLWIGLIALGAVLLSVIPLASTDRMSQLLNTQGGTSFLRLKLWQGTIRMIQDHPIFGVGLDNFLYQYRTRYVLPEVWQEPSLSHPHNVILDYWTRLGILGLIVLVWQQTNFFRLGLRTYRLFVRQADRALAVALLAVMVYALGHGLIDNSFFLVDLSFFLVLTIGLMVGLACQGQQADGDIQSDPSQRA